MSQDFVFLELLDPEVNALLWEIKRTLGGRASTDPVHLTVRGPYEGSVPARKLAWWREVMSHDVIRIAGIGRFDNGGEQVVYIGVDSPHLREIWWKPDFPVGGGFAPHLSLYRGADKVFADGAANVLREKPLELLCAEFRIVPRRSKQAVLALGRGPETRDLTRLIEAGRMDEGLLPHLRAFVRRYHHERDGAGEDGPA